MPGIFPPLHQATQEGLLAVGGNLDIEILIEAYSNGIFPWPIDTESPMAWFSPDPRGIIPFENFHISRSFRRFLNNSPYKISFNSRFKDVLIQCARTPRTHESGTWISEEIINAYTRMFHQGLAYSVEILEGDLLVGGLYGVCLNGIVSGESMFHHRNNTSKLALYVLMQKLKDSGINWLDTQMVTGVVRAMGGIEIPRKNFTELISNSQSTITREDIFGS